MGRYFDYHGRIRALKEEMERQIAAYAFANPIIPLETIADQFGVHITIVKRACRNNGLTRPRGRKPMATQAVL